MVRSFDWNGCAFEPAPKNNMPVLIDEGAVQAFKAERPPTELEKLCDILDELQKCKVADVNSCLMCEVNTGRLAVKTLTYFDCPDKPPLERIIWADTGQNATEEELSMSGLKPYISGETEETCEETQIKDYPKIGAFDGTIEELIAEAVGVLQPDLAFDGKQPIAVDPDNLTDCVESWSLNVMPCGSEYVDGSATVVVAEGHDFAIINGFKAAGDADASEGGVGDLGTTVVTTGDTTLMALCVTFKKCLDKAGLAALADIDGTSI